MTAETWLVVVFACVALIFMFMFLNAVKQLEGLGAANKRLEQQDMEIVELRAKLIAASAARAPEPSLISQSNDEPDYYANAPEPAARTVPVVLAEVAAPVASKAPAPSTLSTMRQRFDDPDYEFIAPEAAATRPLPVVRQPAKKQDDSPTFSFWDVMKVMDDTRLELTSAEVKRLHARLVKRRGEPDPKAAPSKSTLWELNVAYRSKSIMARTQAMLDYAFYNFTDEQLDEIYSCLARDKPDFTPYKGGTSVQLTNALLSHSINGEDYWSRPRD